MIFFRDTANSNEILEEMSPVMVDGVWRRFSTTGRRSLKNMREQWGDPPL